MIYFNIHRMSIVHQICQGGVTQFSSDTSNYAGSTSFVTYMPKPNFSATSFYLFQTQSHWGHHAHTIKSFKKFSCLLAICDKLQKTWKGRLLTKQRIRGHFFSNNNLQMKEETKNSTRNKPLIVLLSAYHLQETAVKAKTVTAAVAPKSTNAKKLLPRDFYFP